ncbi:ran-binding protein 3-like isoform X2 [Cuculus canorus]|uniref:ran-binding protein 3-like isoform X2 n=1 Tax=Cuculus canorus TaxID=55661 RepID=UPI0023AA5582|nr:ran-binding protein 3-like isoform X2 [Cuculus canorus]
MRHRPIPACKGNVLRAGVRRCCARSEASVRSAHSAKTETERRGCPAVPRVVLQEQSTCWPCPSALDPKEECCPVSAGLGKAIAIEVEWNVTGRAEGPIHLEDNDGFWDTSKAKRSVLAQPTVVFGKKERPLTRPAEDPICKAENDTTLVQKRGRSSSFTVLPTFPPSHSGCGTWLPSLSGSCLVSFFKTEKASVVRCHHSLAKNNIFMTSALLQRNIDLIKSTKEGSLSQSQLRNVLRPAILQPPQALTCPENPVLSLVTKKEACVQPPEDSSYSSAENSVSSKTAVRLSTTTNLSSCKTIQSQLFEDRSLQNSRNSDFVFGENMVERVLSHERHPKPCNEANLYKGQITYMYTESSHVSPQTKTALLRNATLIESAAACISKPVEKILLDKVEVITGEEAEHNVLQINCKLFVFNKLSLTWTERGRGSLRLNDTSSNKCGMLQSRLIMRNQGSLRLILNTRLWDQMVIKRANSKSLCFTATNQEDHSVQVFLIQAGSKDTGYLYTAIHHRLVALRSFAEQEPDANQVDTESEIAFQLFNCESDDEDDEKITQVSSSGSDHSRWNCGQSVVCS